MSTKFHNIRRRHLLLHTIIIIRCLNIVSPPEIGLRPVKLAVIEHLFCFCTSYKNYPDILLTPLASSEQEKFKVDIKAWLDSAYHHPDKKM